MSDLKPLPERPTLSLPAASYPARKPMPPPQAPPPESKPEAPKAANAEPDIDFLFAARRDHAQVCFELVNGKELTGTIIALGRYSLSVLVGGSARPEVLFKHGLLRMRRASCD